MNIEYRTLRADHALSIAKNTQVTVNAQHEVEWSDANHGMKNSKVTLVVCGNLTEKAQSYPVEWKFPVTDEEIKQIEDGILKVGDAVRAKQEDFTPPLEWETRCDVFPWLRIGFIRTSDKNKYFGYFEFKREEQKLRALVENIPAMEQLRRILMP
ncbi:hypothetical protein [Opitutus sp. GAS368]|uniref:hypothetical protein n=1 Tax=Opitutus sp. GAS368 TaxID=1882749 RepID=UPI00087AE110|nr:hypothetical protein [Opitutus sp. GAS368]SDR67452.1 hypothetical protein SAMN05444173_0309 [Opitutus sp. GAS368]